MPDPELEAHLARLLDAWIAERAPGQTLPAWAASHDDAHLKAVLLGEPAGDPLSQETAR